MKLLVALDNVEIKNIIDEKYSNQVYPYDINCMEDVIDFLSHKKTPYIVVTKDSLPGNLDKRMYIKQIRAASIHSKIIYITEKLEEGDKEYLFANEIFNIIEGKHITIDMLVDCIENPQSVVYKDRKEEKKIELKKTKVKLIGVIGVEGSGKSIVSSFIAKKLSNEWNTILIDMNLKNPSIDIINNIDSHQNTLNQYVEDVDNNRKKSEKFENYWIEDYQNNKLKYMTACFEEKGIKEFHMKKLIQDVQKHSDITIVDLPSDLNCEVTKFWIQKVHHIIFVINPNYLCIRQAIRYLDKIRNNSSISKNKIYIMVNKYQKGSLDISQIKGLMSLLPLDGVMEYSNDIEGYINGGSSTYDIQHHFTNLYRNLRLNNKKASIKDIYLKRYLNLKQKLKTHI